MNALAHVRARESVIADQAYSCPPGGNKHVSELGNGF